MASDNKPPARWAEYSVNAGYAEWSETPGRVTDENRHHYMLFAVLRAEAKVHDIETRRLQAEVERSEQMRGEALLGRDDALRDLTTARAEVARLQGEVEQQRGKKTDARNDAIKALAERNVARRALTAARERIKALETELADERSSVCPRCDFYGYRCPSVKDNAGKWVTDYTTRKCTHCGCEWKHERPAAVLDGDATEDKNHE